MAMSKAAAVRVGHMIDSCHARVMRVLESDASTGSAYVAMKEAYEIAAKQEKEHRAFGARLLGRKPQCKVPVAVAARLFVMRAFAEGLGAGRSVDAGYIVSLRRDLMLAEVAGRSLGHEAHAKVLHAIESAGGSLTALKALDYTEIVAEDK